MTATTALTTTAPSHPGTGPLLGAGLGATVLASAATTVTAAAGRAAGIGLDVSGAPIPVLGFAVLTTLCSLVGLVLAVVLARWVRHARAAFVRTAVVVTALSLVPDVLADAAPATKGLLMLTHVVAAVIVTPALARRLPS